VAWEEWRKVGSHTNGTHTRATTTVRNAESLVEVKMADISTNSARAGQTHLGIHDGTIHVNLTAILMNNIANVDDALLKSPQTTALDFAGNDMGHKS